MGTEYLVTSLLVLFSPLLFIVIVGVVIYVLVKMSKGNGKPEQVISLSELEKLQKNGNMTIQEVIDSYKVESKTDVVVPNISKTVPEPTVDSTSLKVVDKSDNSKLILYLGSGLVTFAMLALVTLGWNTISAEVKIGLLLLNVVGFLVSGLYLSKHKSLGSVGSTFLFVGSLGFMLFLVGVWNFLLAEVYFDLRYIYWLLASTISVLLNYLLLKLSGEDRFFNLGLFSLYSLLMSLAFLLSTQEIYRIVVFMVLNTLLLISQNVLKGNNLKKILFTSRLINVIGSVLIIGTVGPLLTSGLGLEDKLLITLGLLISTLFTAFDYYRSRSRLIGFEFVLFLIKYELLVVLWGLSVDVIFIGVGVLIAIYIMVSHFIFERSSKALYFLTLILAGIMSTFIVFHTLANSITNTGVYTFSTLLLTNLIVFGSLLLIPLVKKRSLTTGIVLTYSVLILHLVLDWLFPEMKYTSYMYVYLSLALTISVGNTLLRKLYSQNYSRYLLPSSIVLGFLSITTLIMALFNREYVESGFAIVNGFFALLLVHSTMKYYFSRGWFSRLGLNFSALGLFISLLNYGYFVHWQEYITQYSHLSPLLIIPILVFWLVSEFSDAKIRWIDLLAFVASVFIGITMALGSEEMMLIQVLLLTAISIYRFIIKGRVFDFIGLPVLLSFNVSLVSNIFVLQNDITLLILVGVFLSLVLVSRLFKTLELSIWTKVAYTFITLVTLIGSLAYTLNGEFNIVYVLVYLLATTLLLLTNSNFTQKLSGIPLVLLVWGAVDGYSLNAQFYIVPITIYLLSLSYLYIIKGRIGMAIFVRNSALLLQLSSLFIQTLGSSDLRVAIYSGVSLILLSTVVLVFSIIREDRVLRLMGITFLLLGLFVRLYMVIITIPWWIYIAILGLFLIVLAIYRIGKEK